MGIYLLHAPVILKVSAMVINRFIAIPVVSFAMISIAGKFVSYYVAVIISRSPIGGVMLGITRTRNAKESALHA